MRNDNGYLFPTLATLTLCKPKPSIIKNDDGLYMSNRNCWNDAQRDEFWCKVWGGLLILVCLVNLLIAICAAIV